MTPAQIVLVEQSYAEVKPIADVAAKLFYQRLFQIAPEVQPLFKGDIEEQGRKLMSVLTTAISLLRHPEKLGQALEQLGRRHRGYGVSPEQFVPVGQALIWTLEQGLKERFTSERRDAWLALYEGVTQAMLAGLQADTQPVQSAPLNAQQASAAASSAPPSPWWVRLFFFWRRSPHA
jgi:nitric oxide dioxygenase